MTISIRYQRYSCASAGKKGCRGAIYVETILILPLFIIGVLVAIWIGTLLNAKSALLSGISRSLRIAATRGNPQLVGGHLISDIEAWTGTGRNPVPASAPSERMKKLLMYPMEHGNWTWQSAYNYYNTNTLRFFGGANGNTTLEEMPQQYLYALVYLNEAIRQSVGPSVRYPCNPESQDGYGCMSCVFVAPNGQTTGTASLRPSTERYGLECSYRPGNTLLQPVDTLLHLVSGLKLPPVIVKRKVFFDVSTQG